MKTQWLLVMLTGLLSVVAEAEEALLYRVGPEQLETFSNELPEGTAVHVDPAIGEVRVTFAASGPTSFPLYEVPLSDVENCVLEYRAEIASEDLRGTGSLEMVCAFPGEPRYFSRSLQEYVRATTAFRASAAPFFLESGQRPEKVWLGIYAEGTGTVALRNLSLWKKPLVLDSGMAAARLGVMWGMAGAALGILSGLWGAAGALLAGKGRARGLVLGTAWGYMAVGFALIVYGGSTLARGGAMWRAYPPLLLGAIALLLGAMGWRMFRQRYRMAEEQRMAALDISESSR